MRQEKPDDAYAVWRKSNLHESIAARKNEMESTLSSSTVF